MMIKTNCDNTCIHSKYIIILCSMNYFKERLLLFAAIAVFSVVGCNKSRTILRYLFHFFCLLNNKRFVKTLVWISQLRTRVYSAPCSALLRNRPWMDTILINYFSLFKKRLYNFFEIREESCFLYREGCVCSKEERKGGQKLN